MVIFHQTLVNKILRCAQYDKTVKLLLPKIFSPTYQFKVFYLFVAYGN